MHPLHIYQPTPDVLAIDWQDGTRSQISARDLRRSCPCSECASKVHSESASFTPLMSSRSAQIDVVDLIGSSALHVVWKDGHSRSIYRYEMLRSIAPPRMPDASDFREARSE